VSEQSNGPMQCYIGGNHMSMVTHDEDKKIPPGFACLAIDNNGWFGTSNGWPLMGQPALFPIAQAEAIVYAWGSALKNIPSAVVHPSCLSTEARKWLRWSEEAVREREKETETRYL